MRCLLAQRGRLYAGTDAERVFVSGDHGENWTPLRWEFPGHAQVFVLGVVPALRVNSNSFETVGSSYFGKKGIDIPNE